MAKPFGENRVQNDAHSFTPDKNGDAARNVVDIESHELLESINNALGGSTDTTVNIYNIGTTANTEFSQALPANCKGFRLRSRGNSKTQIAYTAGTTDTVFLTVPPGGEWKDDKFYASQTIYFRTTKDETVELITFV